MDLLLLILRKDRKLDHLHLFDNFKKKLFAFGKICVQDVFKAHLLYQACRDLKCCCCKTNLMVKPSDVDKVVPSCKCL